MTDPITIDPGGDADEPGEDLVPTPEVRTYPDGIVGQLMRQRDQARDAADNARRRADDTLSAADQLDRQADDLAAAILSLTGGNDMEATA